MSRSLAIAATFKHEDPYLCEWLEYHLLIGVEHFYLYDQDGGAPARALLAPYQRAGLVTRHPWTHFEGTRHDGPARSIFQISKNHKAYAHCAQHHRHEVDWLMKIDVDEFLFPTTGTSVLPYLRTLDRTRVAGLSVARYNFGDDGHRTPPPGLVLESYLHREAVSWSYKELGNTRFLTDNRFCRCSHSWSYRTLRLGRLLKKHETGALRVHHYYTKSLEEYLRRQNCSRKRVLTQAGFEERNRLTNEVSDRSMLQFVPLIKAALQARAD